MKNSMEVMYAEYGRYISRFRAIPYYIDILRPSERRILLSGFEISKNKSTKSAKVVGHCIGNYHPHGDTSSYGTLVKLANKDFFTKQGNFGFKGLIPSGPAAMRYTEVKMKEWLINLAFKFIDYVDWINYEYEFEPEFLPSPIPVGLIGEGINIGTAFHKTVLPRYKFNDLKNRMKYLLDYEKDNKTKNVDLIPHIHGNKVTLNKNYKDLLSKGFAKVTFIADHKSVDKSKIVNGYEIEIPINPSKLKKFVETNDLSIKDLTSKNLVKIFISGKNIDYKKLHESLINSISFNCLVINDKNQVIRMSIDEMLINNYNKFKEVLVKYYNKKLSEKNNIIYDYEIIKEIKKFLENNRINNIDNLINSITNFPSNDIKNVISKYHINTLFKIDLDVESINKEIKEIQNNINNIDNYTYNYLNNISID